MNFPTAFFSCAKAYRLLLTLTGVIDGRQGTFSRCGPHLNAPPATTNFWKEACDKTGKMFFSKFDGKKQRISGSDFFGHHQNLTKKKHTHTKHEVLVKTFFFLVLTKKCSEFLVKLALLAQTSCYSTADALWNIFIGFRLL